MIRLPYCVVVAVVLMVGQVAVAHADAFVWQITDGDTDVYLAGSIHLLPPSAYPLPQPFQAAFADAETVVFETDIGQLRQTQARTRLYRAARYDHGGIAADLDDRLYTRLSDALEAMGRSLSAMRAFKPWFVASTIELGAFRAAGFQQKLGVDVHFYEKALELDKQTLALETVDRHLQLLTKMPLKMQLAYLRTTLVNIDKLQQAPSVIYGYWREGDAAGLAAYVRDQVEAAPALFERILFRRNQRWLGQIEHLIDGSKDAMVIVGALHLVGKRGLVRQLEQRGYRVVQL